MDSSSTIHTSGQRVANRRNAMAADSSASPPPQAVLQFLYGPVADELVAVENLLQNELQSQIEALAPLLRHGTQLGGKRLRPAMLLLAAKACGAVSEEQIALATVIEMVHTATLIHDDVLDDATTRRHVPTINARWSNHTSILLGDYLFAQSFRLAATNSSAESCALIGEAARLVCEGELRQVLHRDILDLDEEAYVEMVRGKTAELCRVACQLGAASSGAAPATIDALAAFGDAVGVAFQIADDYLDLWGDDGQVGKTLGTDVQQGKMTLPLIRLMATCNAREKTELVAILTGSSDCRVAEILPWLDRSDARQYTASAARRFQQQAIDALSGLPPSPALRSLRAIAEFAVDRTF